MKKITFLETMKFRHSEFWEFLVFGSSEYNLLAPFVF